MASVSSPSLLLSLLLLAAACLLAKAVPRQGSNDFEEEEDEQPIQDLPEFISSPKNFTAKPGTSVRLTCQVNAMTVPLMWSRDDSDGKWVILSLGENMAVKPEEKYRYRIRKLDNNQGLMLTVDDLRESDSGLYKCNIMASQDRQQTLKFWVRVGDFPEETAADKEASASASDGANGSAGDGGGASSVAAGGLAMALLPAVTLQLLFRRW